MGRGKINFGNKIFLSQKCRWKYDADIAGDMIVNSIYPWKKPWPISVTRIFVLCLHNISIVNICPLCVPGITFWLIDWYSNLATTPCPSYPFVNIPTRQYSIESNQLYIESVILHEILPPLSVLFNKVVMKQFANMYLPDQWPFSRGRLHYIQWLMMIG